MKTLFISIYDGHISKSILHTGVFQSLRALYEIVLFVPKSKVEYYQDHFGGPTVHIEALPVANFPKLEIGFAQGLINSIHADNIRIRIDFNYASGQCGIVKKSIRLLLWYLGRFKLWREFLRFLYRLIPDHSYDEFFKHYNPDAVFPTNMISHDDMRLIKGARRFRVPVMGMMKSWDNITSKAFVPMKPDWFIAQSEILKKEMIRVIDFPDQDICVTGFPQFDIYNDESIYQTKESFFAAMKLDARKRLILYCGAGTMIAPHDREVLEELLDAIEDGRIPNAQVLFRLHPKYHSEEEKLKPRSFLVVDRPGHNNAGKLSHWEFDRSDIAHLANSVRHCDVLMCTASTMNIEAALFDRPSVNPAFDGKQKLPAALSVERRYRYDHQMNINRTGGIKIAYTPDEMVSFLNAYLANPSLDKEGRARIVSEQCFQKDGKAAERIVAFIREKLGV